MEAAPPEGTLLRLFHSMGLVRQILEPFFARYGLSGPQWAILRILQRAGDCGEGALSQKEISRRLLIQPPSVTALVNRLERMGMLQRGSSDDHRVRMVALTDAGRDRIAGVLESHPGQIRTMFAGFTAAELKDFHGLLGQLGTHLASLSTREPFSSAKSSGPAKARPRLQRSPRTK